MIAVQNIPFTQYLTVHRLKRRRDGERLVRSENRGETGSRALLHLSLQHYACPTSSGASLGEQDRVSTNYMGWQRSARNVGVV